MNMRATAPAIIPVLALALNGCATALAPASLDIGLRPGFHGVEDEDWEAIFAFLDAHFPAR